MAPNPVWSIFDFTVVVANTGAQPAAITVTGPDGFVSNTMVPVGALQKIYLPWVKDLKGVDFNGNAALDNLPTQSVTHKGGAFHLVSTQPVTVYQFNALEYKGQGGDLRDWSSCPGNKTSYGCFSFSNDASLLLPTSALTGNYRVTGLHGEVQSAGFGSTPGMPTYVVVTATVDNTQVHVKLSKTAQIVAGGDIPATPLGGTADLTMNTGDVAVLLGAGGIDGDFSGSLIKATQPIQVITGSHCLHNPGTANACDHLESTLFPVETLGKDYVVTVPTGPRGFPVGHTVRLYGDVDGTQLTFNPPIAMAPSVLNAGDMVDLGQVMQDFEVKATHEIEVATFMLGGSIVDPTMQSGMQEGDPSASHAVAVEQYRSDYVFLAPDDYDFSFADVVTPPNNTITLDGMPVNDAPVAIPSSSFGVLRLPLDSTHSMGVHHLTASNPVGIQVVGYGYYTSYQYPAGLDLAQITNPPPG